MVQRNSEHNILALLYKIKWNASFIFTLFMTFYFRLSSSELYVSPEKMQAMMDIVEA